MDSKVTLAVGHRLLLSVSEATSTIMDAFTKKARRDRRKQTERRSEILETIQPEFLQPDLNAIHGWKGMRGIAERYDCILVDLFTATEEAVWLLNDDECLYNDVGQQVPGFWVFNAIAGKCSLIEKRHQTGT